MRILLVHNTLNDSASISGVLREYANLARAWQEDGHAVDFLAARVGFKQLRALAPGSGLVSSDNCFDATGRLHQSWRNFPAYAWRCMTARMTRFKEKPDVVYATCPFVVEAYCARVLARRLGVPWVMKVQHVLGAQANRTGFLNRLLLWGERKSTQWTNREAARVLCLSPPVARDYAKLEESLGLRPVDPVVVGSSIDLGQFQVLKEEEKTHDVVFLGRMHELKGVFDLPRVWGAVLKERPEARLVVIGEGPHRKVVEAEFAAAGLADNVEFTGGIPEKQKNDLLARARVGLSLSSEEGWGLAVNEYLACSLPVVAYDLPVFREVFPNCLEDVPQGDWEKAASKIVSLLKDANRCRERGQAGREFVQRYDYREMAREELAVLESVCGDSG